MLFSESITTTNSYKNMIHRAALKYAGKGKPVFTAASWTEILRPTSPWRSPWVVLDKVLAPLGFYG